jgi:hypothetical protein
MAIIGLAPTATLHVKESDSTDFCQETDGEEYEMNGESPSNLHEIDGIHDGLVRPTEEELATLRRVGDSIPWNAYRMFLLFRPNNSEMYEFDSDCNRGTS